MEFIETILTKEGVVLKIYNKSDKTITFNVNYYEHDQEHNVNVALNVVIECKPNEMVMSKELLRPIRINQSPEKSSNALNVFDLFSGRDISSYKTIKKPAVISFDDNSSF